MADQPQISICIPAYDMGGYGAEFLAVSFDHLLEQSLKNFEIVVSDQSDTGQVSNVCDSYSDRLTIRRVDYRAGPRQASANTNNAMRHADGAILKVLFQDDFLCADDALALMASGLENGPNDWALVGSGVTRDGAKVEHPMVPRLTPKLHFARNTVSSPSVLAIRAGRGLYFDEELIWLMDVEFYKRCHDALGPPLICPQTLVANRLHEGQVSAGVAKSLKRTELAYVRQKYRNTETWAGTLEYYRQILKTR